LCFDENSTVEGEFGTVFLKDVSPGDRVQTLRSDGSVTYTEVVNAYVSTRDSGFDALEAILADGRKIVATRSQPFPVLRGGTEVVLEGGQLARGDILMTSGGTSEVVSLMNTTLSKKRLIETRAGTVLVNGILASTGVADPTPQFPRVFGGEFSTMVNMVV